MKLIDRLSSVARGEQRQEAPREGPIKTQREDTRPSLPSGFVRSILDMRDAVPHTTRQGEPGYIHASALPGLCPRQHVLMVSLGIRVDERITGAHRVMWTVGRAVEQHIRDQLIDGYPSSIFGLWSCLCGSVQHRGHKPHDKHCTGCGTPATNYNELTLTSDEYGVTGNPDIILRHEGAYVPVEIKSMTGEDWKALKQPMGNHLAQVSSYRRLMEEVGMPVHNDVVVVYCSKHFNWGSPYKEFHTNASTTQNTDAIAHLFNKAKQVKEATPDKLPPRTVCSSRNSKRAKACPVADTCFARSAE